MLEVPPPMTASTSVSALELTTRVAGATLAREVEEYFEQGARVTPGDVVFDVGANVGAFAAAVVSRTGPEVTLHCFEPASASFEKLVSSFARHSALRGSSHALHPVALSTRELEGVERSFYYFDRFPTDSTYDIESKKREFEAFFAKRARALETALAGRVPWLGAVLGRVLRAAIERLCRSDNRLGVWLAWRATGMRETRCLLDSVERIARRRGIDRIDLLKIDVEGAELDVLEGCGAAWPAIRQVVVETVDREGRAERVRALLAANGLEIVGCRAPRIAADGDAGQLLIIARRPS
jgi:FkbM family methyltransferase